MSETKSPPKKKTNVDITNSRDNKIEALEVKNSNLAESVEKNQEQLNKQANIIGKLREEMHELKVNVQGNSEEREKLKNLYNELLEESKRSNQENESLRKRI